MGNVGKFYVYRYIRLIIADELRSQASGASIPKHPPEVFYKKGVLVCFAKVRGKHLCQILFLNKVGGLNSATLLKKRFWHWNFKSYMKLNQNKQ